MFAPAARTINRAVLCDPAGHLATWLFGACLMGHPSRRQPGKQQQFSHAEGDRILALADS
jgi:hypothetical protein